MAAKLLFVDLENYLDVLTVFVEPRQCSVEGFRQLLDVECDTAIVIANLFGVCGFVIIMCISIVIIKRRYALNACELQHLNQSSENEPPFLARDSMLSTLYAIAHPSVRLSHGWISRKQLNLGSCNFHCTVAPLL